MPTVPTKRTAGSSFVTIAALLLATALGGFSFTYWGPLLGGQRFGAVIHTHALLWFGWFGLLTMQAGLVRARRTDWHRTAGVGVALYTGVLIAVSLGLAVTTIARDVSLITGGLDSVPTIIPLTQIAMFSAFFLGALLRREAPETHKRFLVLAALVGVTPAFARVSIGMLGAPNVPLLLLVSSAVLVAVVLSDWRIEGRLHPVYLWGGVAIVVVRIVRVPLAMSPAWRWTAEAVAARLGGSA